MEIGDKVRFLNDVGGGTIVGFQGKDIVLVRGDDDFDIPVLRRELVVVTTNALNIARPAPAPLPEEAVSKGARALLHDIDEADADTTDADTEPADRPVTFRPRALERAGADVLNVFLAFVRLRGDEQSAGIGLADPDARFEAYLVNDCNYTLRCTLLRHDGPAVSVAFEGEVEANTKLPLADITRDKLGEWERLSFQAVLFKRDKLFKPKAPLNVGLRVDTTKFFKAGAFARTAFFDADALLLPIAEGDRPVRSVFVDAAEMKDVLTAPAVRQPRSARPAEERRSAEGILEIDLHADALLDVTTGLSANDILQHQLAKFREAMDALLASRGGRVIFIHGKGDGVLRTRLRDELRHRYKRCRFQDASFAQYGFGATLVTL